MIGSVAHAPTNRADLLTILSNPSEITSAELRANGLDPFAAVEYVVKAMERGEAWTFTEDGNPVCILGLARHGDTSFNTWFVSTQRFFDLGTATLFPARRMMVEIRRRYPTADITSHTWSSHKSVRRWFEILGFRYVSANEGCSVFELPKSA